MSAFGPTNYGPSIENPSISANGPQPVITATLQAAQEVIHQTLQPQQRVVTFHNNDEANGERVVLTLSIFSLVFGVASAVALIWAATIKAPTFVTFGK